MMGSGTGASPGAEASNRLIHHLILFYSPLSASLHTAAVLFIALSCSLDALLASSPLRPHSLGASSPSWGGDGCRPQGPRGSSARGECGLRRKADN